MPKGQPRIIEALKDTHMTTAELAEKMFTEPSTVKGWLHQGKLRGEKYGKIWLIKRVDAALFAAAYSKLNNGDDYSPDVERRPQHNRRPITAKRIPQTIEIPGELLWRVDDERARRAATPASEREGTGLTRTHVIVDAIRAYLTRREAEHETRTRNDADGPEANNPDSAIRARRRKELRDRRARIAKESAAGNHGSKPKQ